MDGLIRSSVLIVDDHALIRSMLVTLLADHGRFEGVAAFPGVLQALDSLTELAPDVVLMDLNLPGLDGVEGTRRVRQSLPGTHVIILTGTADLPRQDAALQAGACRVLTKDILPEHLVASIRRCVIEGRPRPQGAPPAAPIR